VLAGHAYFAAPPPKSCGRELFDARFLDGALARVPAVSPADLMATLTELTALTVAQALAPYQLTEVVVSGGGVRNAVLVRALRRRLPAPSWRTSDELGLPSDGKEAYLVALLGALTWHGMPGTVRAADGRTVTGARRATVLGRITPPPAQTSSSEITLPTRLTVQAVAGCAL
jgi:anhydro-N-acetylmuramic acid kinase